MTVKTVAEAWKVAHRLLPGIGELKYNKNAGYKVAEAENGWVSDLNTRLEVNFVTGESMNIWIEQDLEPVPVQHKIEKTVYWNASKVQQYCISRGLYTRGDNEEYGEMLRFVNINRANVTEEKVYKVARNILNHSCTTLDVSDIMTGLFKRTVEVWFEVDEGNY